MVAIVAMSLLVFVHVMGRYIFNFPILFAEELTVIIMFVVIFGVVPQLFARSEHLRVDIVVDKFPPKVRHWVDVAMNIVAVVVMGVFTWYIVRLFIIIYIGGYYYQVLRLLPKWPVYMVISICVVVSTIFLLVNLFRLLGAGKVRITEGKGEKQDD